MRFLKSFFFVCLITILTAGVGPQAAHADFPERPVGFVVIDQDDGGVDGAMYKSWRQVVKWAYHFPYYQLIEGGEPLQVVSDAVDRNLEFNKATLQALTEKSKVDVLVVARIYALDETMVNGWGFRFDNDTYMRVIAFADLYVYKKDGDKFLKRRVRENGVHELGNYEKPEETIKWQLSKLVNTMEGRPIIGS